MIDRIKDFLSRYIQDTQVSDLLQEYISLEFEKSRFPEMSCLLTEADVLAKAEIKRRHSEVCASLKAIHKSESGFAGKKELEEVHLLRLLHP